MYRWYSPYHYYQHHPAYRNFPAVDTTILEGSVSGFQILLQQSQVLLKSLENREFAKQLIETAQKGHQQQVDQMIQNIPGFTSRANIQYTPSGIRFLLLLPTTTETIENPDCCSMSLELKWGT
ncbi:hypothetical protein [Geomicrobium sp. JCM 19055]|uniref:hypothetical protein n=1 Tax=Geomicrobium sp. JCM 19055 TaxID=1460649 RepID=UPI00045ED372|nr:hypothetical protein [Geomicrobium sp. JCM 19055]GAK00401.1 hypothetical protein JCM19055_3487 [Geomicrobium sp. JCM 19055]